MMQSSSLEAVDGSDVGHIVEQVGDDVVVVSDASHHQWSSCGIMFKIILKLINFIDNKIIK